MRERLPGRAREHLPLLRRQPEHLRAHNKRQYDRRAPVAWQHHLKRERDNQEIRAFAGEPEQLNRWSLPPPRCVTWERRKEGPFAKPGARRERQPQEPTQVGGSVQGNAQPAAERRWAAGVTCQEGQPDCAEEQLSYARERGQRCQEPEQDDNHNVLLRVLCYTIYRTMIGGKSNAMDGIRYRTLAEFWAQYVREHSRAGTRWLHFAGNTNLLIWLLLALWRRDLRLVVWAVASSYGLAWIGHFGVERNIPATFRYPVMAGVCDLLMFVKMWRGTMDAEVARYTRGSPS